MNKDLKKAIEILKEGKHTCVLCRGDIIHISDETGIKPMINFISSEYDLGGFSVADKIVGKAAAMLFKLAGVENVYADVMSEKALNYLNLSEIYACCDELTDDIINRDGSGICPMEKAVAEINEPDDAYKAILKTIEFLKVKQNT